MQDSKQIELETDIINHILTLKITKKFQLRLDRNSIKVTHRQLMKYFNVANLNERSSSGGTALTPGPMKPDWVPTQT